MLLLTLGPEPSASTNSASSARLHRVCVVIYNYALDLLQSQPLQKRFRYLKGSAILVWLCAYKFRS